MRALACLLALALLASPCSAKAPAYPLADALRGGIVARFEAGNLDGLLRDADQFLASRAQLPDGRWKLSVFYGGLDRWLDKSAASTRDWADREKALTGLASRHPRSPNAWVMLASLQLDHAWAIRGTSDAGNVDPDADVRFRALLEQARDVLEAHKEVASACPEWYALRILVGSAGGESSATIDSIFAEAIRKSPDYPPTWYCRLQFLEPKWRGSEQAMAEFIANAARHPSSSEGAGMAANLLWMAWSEGYPAVIRRPEIDAAMIRQSREDLLKHHPDAFNVRNLVLVACTRPDKAATASLLARLEKAATAAELGDQAKIYELCSQWARGDMPVFLMRDAMTGEELLVE